jgi:hypothetical protein
MDEHPTLRFESYDRLFPAQDILPKGGFGNLIALPLQGFARRSDNSVFLDAESNPYDDQWQFLSSVRRISPEEIETFLARVGEKETLGILSPLADAKTGSGSKPWVKQSKKSPLNATDFPSMHTDLSWKDLQAKNRSRHPSKKE